MSDQASSLRQLAQPSLLPPAFAVFGAWRAGSSSVAAELAAASTQAGRRTLLVGHDATQSLARRLGAPPSSSLQSLSVSRGSLSELMVDTRCGCTLVNLYAPPAERDRLSPHVWRRLASEFAALEQDHATLLVDAPDYHADPTPLCVVPNLILVVTPDTDTLTAGYAALKHLAGDYARRRFNVIINRARNLEQARKVFSRLSSTTGEFLSVSLRWVGFVPDDPLLAKAQMLHRPVMDAFPDSEAAQAFRQLAQAMPLWHDDKDARGSYLQQLFSTGKALADLSHD